MMALQVSLMVSCTAFAQTDASSSCSQSLDQLKQKNESLYNSAKSRIHGKTDQLDQCYAMMNEHLRDCDRTPNMNDFCKKAGTATVPGDGTIGAVDNQISSLVYTANCQFAVSNCYINKSMSESALKINRNKDCWFDQEKTASQHNYADPADADQAGDAEVIKDYAIDFYVKVDRPQSTCWRKMGANPN